MILIAILLALATERVWYNWSIAGKFSVLTSWRERLLRGNHPWLNGPVGVLLTILPLVVVVAVVQYYLSQSDHPLMWLLDLVFSVVILIICVGNHRFDEHVQNYVKTVSEGRYDDAATYLNEISTRTFCGKDLRQLNRDLISLMLLRQSDRVLAIMFWFVILGPLGAILYRSVGQLMGAKLILDGKHMPGADYQDAVKRLKGILDWIPARLTALCYALIGSFNDAFHLWWEDPQRPDDDWIAANDRLLVDVGLGALQLRQYYIDDGAEIDAAMACDHALAVRDLSRRTILTGMTILALLTISGQLV